MKRDEIPEKFKAAVNAMRVMIMSDGLITSELEDDHPLRYFQVIEKNHGGQARNWRAEVEAGFQWLAGLNDSYQHVPRDNNLAPKQQEVLGALIGMGTFRGQKSISRRMKAMELVNEALSPGTSAPATAAIRRRQWDAYQRTDLPRLLRRVCQILSWEGEATAQTSQPHVKYAPQGYHLRSYELTYNLPPSPGGKRQVLTRREVVADADVSRWSQTHKDYGHGKVHPDIELFGPGQLVVQNVGAFSSHGADGHAFEVVIEFDEILKDGDATTFSILHSEAVPWPQLVRDGFVDQRGLEPKVDIEHVSMRVRFPESRMPAQVWRFVGLHDWLVPGVPGESDLLSPDASRSVSATWQNPAVGRSLGVAWRW